MTRPFTLFTGQWADLPFEEVARLAGSWGYDGLEIACSGDHLDASRWDDEAYVDSRREILERHGLRSLDQLEKLLLQVTRKNDIRGYERFKDLFEAIVAYNE